MPEVIVCKCGREQCKNEMKIVRYTQKDGKPSIMLLIARPHEWGTSNVRTVALNQEDREYLCELLIAPEQIALHA